jgi:hypothetical protein
LLHMLGLDVLLKIFSSEREGGGAAQKWKKLGHAFLFTQLSKHWDCKAWRCIECAIKVHQFHGVRHSGRGLTALTHRIRRLGLRVRVWVFGRVAIGLVTSPIWDKGRDYSVPQSARRPWVKVWKTYCEVHTCPIFLHI